MTQSYDHWIAGATAPPDGDEYLESLSPATGAVVANIARGTPVDVDRAVRAAAAAHRDWASRRPLERGRALAAVAAAIRANLQVLQDAEQAETGKPAWQLPIEIESAAEYFEFYGGLAAALHGETIDLGASHQGFTRREPFGVVGVITPWNAPLNQAARAIAPAIASGNAVVVKPSEFTSATTVLLGRLATEAGLPSGVINVVTGTGPEVGAALVRHPGVRKVAFTGSIPTGQAIGHIAAERIIPLTLELGGKSANIVFDDADLGRAATGAAMAFAANAGQVCSAGTRLLIQRAVHDEVVSAVVDVVRAWQPGREFGPMITPAQYEKVLRYFDLAADEGAKPVIGGSALTDDDASGGFYVQPTVYTGVTNEMRIAREEIFGPVLSVIAFDDDREAVEIANDSPYGLAAGVWTRDIRRGLKTAAELEAGQVYVNSWSSRHVEAPFGGYKDSGYGREKGFEALHQYTQLKAVIVSLTEEG